LGTAHKATLTLGPDSGEVAVKGPQDVVSQGRGDVRSDPGTDVVDLIDLGRSTGAIIVQGGRRSQKGPDMSRSDTGRRLESLVLFGVIIELVGQPLVQGLPTQLIEHRHAQLTSY
jgi:hypothetical protein